MNYRYYVEPYDTSGSSLDFNNGTTWAYQMQGREQGKKAVDQGEGFVFKQMDKWASTKELQVEYPQLGDYLAQFTK